jgi:hypothetical protein
MASLMPCSSCSEAVQGASASCEKHVLKAHPGEGKHLVAHYHAAAAAAHGANVSVSGLGSCVPVCLAQPGKDGHGSLGVM